VRTREDTIHDREFTINNRNREVTELHASLANLKEMKDLNDSLKREINGGE
jgi:hypothetical protein